MTEDINAAGDPFMDAYGMKVDMRMLKIQGRVLEPPNCVFTVLFGYVVIERTRFQQDQRQQMGAKAIKAPQKEIVFSIVIVDNAVRWEHNTVYVHPLSRMQTVFAFSDAYRNLVEDCKKRGLQFAQDNPIQAPISLDTRRGRIKDCFAGCQAEARKLHPNAAHLVLVIVPKQDSRTYCEF